MTYCDLTIHKRINAKNNALLLWRDPVKRVLKRRSDPIWDCAMYGPEELILRPREYKEPKNAGYVDYDAPDVYEIADKLERELK
jgi:hypothetical protein